jgi:hypothetical protein
MGKMQRHWMLKQTVRAVTTGLKVINMHSNGNRTYSPLNLIRNQSNQTDFIAFIIVRFERHYNVQF